MKILVLNCGSSSIKYQLFEIENKTVLAKGIVDKIGLNGAYVKNTRSDGDEVKLEGEIIDHQAGIEYLLGVLVSDKHGSIKALEEIDAVGHRVVHGAEKLRRWKNVLTLRLCIIRQTLREFIQSKLSFLMFSRLVLLIQHSTRQCFHMPICMLFHIHYMISTE
jgi:acetate kinase